jgi:hypothetical protein
MPLALANLTCVMVIRQFGWSLWWLTASSFVLLMAAAYFTLVKRSPRSGRPLRAQTEPTVALAR